MFPITSEVSKKGELMVGGCNTIELAKQYGTPLYVIDKETFASKCNEYLTGFDSLYKNSLILYAGKAFANKAIFSIANELGLGLDVVSGGELYLALKTNFNKENIFFHGNNKQKDELELAIKNKIGRIVVDNYHELTLINELSQKYNQKTNILIRLTPGIECHTHEYIKTGHLDSKFGFDLDERDTLLSLIKNKLQNISLKGFHAHIGSQIFEINSFTDTISILLDEFKYAKSKFNFTFTELNIGGGIGISYTNEDDPFKIFDWIEKVAKTIKLKCKEFDLEEPKLICEPGRSLIANSGITLYSVGSSKQVPNGRKYIAVDGGMADNPRPITYQAKYHAVAANKINEKDEELVTLAGRYCESGDILIKDIKLPKLNPGDIIAVLGTGAYNYSMASNYNMVPRPACVLVSKGKSEIIIARETYEDLIQKHK
ncbi:MAG: diaminopimelate decarboxylase [Candidatus Melainabacteria bacterium]|nr:diaminopimelate decarboxylase [Candidatus Melainabacteria bacterium]